MSASEVTPVEAHEDPAARVAETVAEAEGERGEIASPPSPEAAAARVRATTEARLEKILEQSLERAASVRAEAATEAVLGPRVRVLERVAARPRRPRGIRPNLVVAIVLATAALAAVGGWELASGKPGLAAPIADKSPSKAATATLCPIPAKYRSAFVSASQRTGVPLSLLTSVASVESRWQPDAVSARGAIGLMQMLRSTADYLHVDPYDVRQNVFGGARFLKLMLAQYHGNTELALAAYDSGPYRVAQGDVPLETVVYVGAVMAQQAATVGCR
jgi:soluble lytic murein transglycosylase-like protein